MGGISQDIDASLSSQSFEENRGAVFAEQITSTESIAFTIPAFQQPFISNIYPRCIQAIGQRLSVS